MLIDEELGLNYKLFNVLIIYAQPSLLVTLYNFVLIANKNCFDNERKQCMKNKLHELLSVINIFFRKIKLISVNTLYINHLNV